VNRFASSGEYLLKFSIVKTALVLVWSAESFAQGAVAIPAFEARGRVVEARRAAAQEQLQRVRASVLDSLRAGASDLVPRLDPAPPPVPQGYQLVPRLVVDPQRQVDTVRRASLYSWPWTDTLIAGLGRSIDRIDSLLGVRTKDRAAYERIVQEFNKVAADRRLIDSHIEHNWFWQRAIAADTARFLRASEMIDSALRGGNAARVSAPAMPRVQMILDDSGSGPVTVRIPLATDIEDTAFVRAAQSVIQRLWAAHVNGRDHRVVVEVQLLSPRQVYCGGAVRPCAPPARGSAIDIASHVARFPAGLAVLTTGGTQPHVLAGRSMVLGPRDLSERTLGHEFGHILGFEDEYLRGFRSLGPDGYAIIEYIPDRSNIMAASAFGASVPAHYTQLVSNLRAERAMKAGLAAMYDRSDARAAVPLFREVLTNRVDHYGATFQLAKALDQSGDSTAALPVWRRILDLARAAGDSTTAGIASTRIRVP
jgi:hypothetical protein